MAEHESAADIAAEHFQEAMRDAAALYLLTIREDWRGAQLLLDATPCKVCLLERVVWLGLMVAAHNMGGIDFAADKISDAARRELDDYFTSYQAASIEVAIEGDEQTGD